MTLNLAIIARVPVHSSDFSYRDDETESYMIGLKTEGAHSALLN